MENKLKPIHGNILLLIGAFLLITVGSAVQSYDLISGLLITEFLLVMAPTFALAYILKINIKKEFRFNGFTLREFVLVTIIMLCFYPMAVFLNSLTNILLSTIGELPAGPIEVPTDAKGFIIYLLVIAGSAGLCEEVMFRGFIMRSYERLGQTKAIILSGVLFGMFHFNLQNLLGPIFLGLIMGYIVIRTNSLWMGIYAHMLNNATALFLGLALAGIPEDAAAEPVTLEAFIMASIVLLFVAAFFSVFGALAIWKLSKVTEHKQEYQIKEKTTLKTWIPVIVFVLLFIGMSLLFIEYLKDPSIFSY